MLGLNYVAYQVNLISMTGKLIASYKNKADAELCIQRATISLDCLRIS